MQRRRRELEGEEAEYEERLGAARKKEAAMKHMAKARVIKKPVRLSISIFALILVHNWRRNCHQERLWRTLATTRSFPR